MAQYFGTHCTAETDRQTDRQKDTRITLYNKDINIKLKRSAFRETCFMMQIKLVINVPAPHKLAT